MSTISLKTVVFLGSARNVPPPWGGDARLGDRVVEWVKSTLSGRASSLGGAVVRHETIDVVDPIDVFGPGGALSHSGAEMRQPTFFASESSLPASTRSLRDVVAGADCYLVVSPEYNHTIPPALASVMGHFGGSNYKCKPAGIVTYSPGPFGGMRAAMAIQIMCHELGCLPVSKLCGLPGPADLLRPDGAPVDPDHRMLRQLPELLDQLEWMAVAMKSQREKTGTF